jgi:hypothetical protein
MREKGIEKKKKKEKKKKRKQPQPILARQPNPPNLFPRSPPPQPTYPLFFCAAQPAHLIPPAR